MLVLAKKRRTAQFNRVPHIPRRPAPVFVANLGAEGYSPAAYLPYILSIRLGHVASFDFVGMLFSMRFAGLVGMTAVSAYAIAIAGPMRWPFFMIGLLPAAVYGRSVISADGAALSYTMVITALCFRITRSSDQSRAWWDSLFMILCVLSKPPQLAFIVLAAMNRPIRELRRYWIKTALTVLPASILSTLWIFATYKLIEGVRNLQVTDLFPDQLTAL